MLTCHAMRHYSLKYKSSSFNHIAARLVKDNLFLFRPNFCIPCNLTIAISLKMIIIRVVKVWK